MKHFSGFPSKSVFTPLPGIFFGSLLPEINDIAELKVTLYIFESLYPKKGSPKFVTYHELLDNAGLVKSLQHDEATPEQSLQDALNKAVERGTLLTIRITGNNTPEDIFFLNTEDNRKAVENIREGKLQLPGIKATGIVPATAEPPDIFVMYEENIGMLTPLIADELRDAEKTYPADWVRDAIKEAVSLNKRNWRYISRVLERWSTEGKKNGTHRQYNKENTDPDKYIKGQYGHIVRR
jgi:DNA replication protein